MNKMWSYKKECIKCHKIIWYQTPADLKRRSKTNLCANCFKHLKGKKSARWHNGKSHTELGYILISKHDHPFAKKNGYVLEQRLVMENHLGRYLKPEEIVHHRNGIKTDNRIENLELTNPSDHARKHNTKHRKCIICDKPHKARGYCVYHYWLYFLKFHRIPK
jgi:hypothetical protein